MTCGIPGHVHVEKEERVESVRRCNLCGTEFEDGVADAGPAGEPRCPQCLMWDTEPIERTDYQRFLIRKSSRFR